jgi:hypothetical protein
MGWGYYAPCIVYGFNEKNQEKILSYDFLGNYDLDVSDNEPEEIYTNCDGCQGEININSYRTYYTKHGVYCKCCVEKLPADEEDDEKTNKTETK